MAKFTAGSAFATARDIGEGYFAVTERWFRGMSAPQLDQLAHEIERLLRELRGAALPGEETAAVQARNRKIQRLNSALAVLGVARHKLRG